MAKPFVFGQAEATPIVGKKSVEQFLQSEELPDHDESFVVNDPVEDIFSM